MPKKNCSTQRGGLAAARDVGSAGDCRGEWTALRTRSLWQWLFQAIAFGGLFVFQFRGSRYLPTITLATLQSFAGGVFVYLVGFVIATWPRGRSWPNPNADGRQTGTQDGEVNRLRPENELRFDKVARDPAAIDSPLGVKFLIAGCCLVQAAVITMSGSLSLGVHALLLFSIAVAGLIAHLATWQAGPHRERRRPIPTVQLSAALIDLVVLSRLLAALTTVNAILLVSAIAVSMSCQAARSKVGGRIRVAAAIVVVLLLAIAFGLAATKFWTDVGADSGY